MIELQKIALLIDADNTQLAKLEAIIREISTHGRIVVKRAYGNWKKEALKNWENELKRMAIKAEQQFDYVSGKNATDMALVIDTVNLLHTGIYDAFVIVASDSDYTPLAIHLHESGIYVMGVGEKKTPEAFRNSCDEFIFLENLELAPEPVKSESAGGKAPEAGPADAPGDSIEEIHSLLRLAYDKYQDEDSYANIGSAGQFIKRAKPDFDVRTYGFVKLSKLIEAFPDKYEMRKSADVISYKCKYSLEEIHSLLKQASDKYRDSKGFVNVNTASQYIKRSKPDFDVKTFGFPRLQKLLEAFPEKYELRKTAGRGNATIISFKCK